MKTKGLFVALMALMMCFVCNESYAYYIAVKNADGVTIYYDLYEGSDNQVTLQVTSDNHDLHGTYSGSVVIPNRVTFENWTLSVTSIGENAFYNCTGLTSVTIPGSVKNIGENAFYYCSGLTSVTIPGSVTSIGNYAFRGCSNLTSVTIQDGVTSIGERVFYNCSGLTSVTIPGSVTSIRDYTFEECTNLTSVTIQDGVTSIGGSAFYNCTNLTSVTIPGSVTSIRERAFQGCTNLTSVHISDLASWCKISFGENPYSFDFGANPLLYAQHLYLNNEEIKDLVIPDGVTSIGNYAFYKCTGLTSVTIPGSVTSIGESAFSGCSGLVSVTIPGSVTSIGNSAFSGCSGLVSVTIPGSVTSIGGSAFWGCTNLTSVAVENGNTVYDSRDNCNAIIKTSTNELILGCKNTTIPGSVTSIGGSAFSNCTNLTSVTIPGSVKNIGNYAFTNCTNLTSLTIQDGVTKIGESAFNRCSGLTSVTIPGSVKNIGKDAFFQCTGLTSVTIQDGVTSIGNGAFSDCPNLTSVTIPGSVKNIENYAFSDCPNLTSLTIQDGVTEIGERAFYKCTGLTSVTIPGSVTSFRSGAFRGCTNLTSVTFRDGVTSIGNYAFGGCSGLTSVTIPGSVTSIGGSAFNGCSELADVYCYAENVPTASTAFIDSLIQLSTLHVPASAIDSYRTTAPWSGFGTIMAMDEQCAKPTIHYQNGKLTFKCETEGVEFVSEITDADIKKSYVAEADLSVTYHITVCATKAGYANSEMATATLCWIDVEPQKEGITEDDEDAFAEVKAMPVLIQSDGNGLMVSGVKAGTAISVYDLSGKLIGNTTSTEGLTRVQAATSEKVVIVKVGERSVKVLK